MSSQSTTADAAMTPPRASALHMYVVVVGVGIICAVAIVIVFESTKPIIRQNAIDLRNQAILDVLPGAQTSAAFRFNESGEFEPTSPSDTENYLIFAAYDDKQQLVGLAFEADGMGYQDIVRVLYGYSFDKQAIVGIRVLQSRETPGLGDRVETDPAFLSNFQALDVSLGPSADALAHPIEFVKPGKKDSAWQIDGISGATITSRAITEMLSESTQTWIPRAYPRRADFKSRSQ